MAFNCWPFDEKVHPRNPYGEASFLNLEALAECHPELYPYLEATPGWSEYETEDERKAYGRGHEQRYRVKFREQAGMTALTEAVLRHDFKLDVRLSKDRIAPPIPARIEYILFLQDLIAARDDVHKKLLALDERYPQQGEASRQDLHAKRRKLSDGKAPAGSEDTVLALDVATGHALINPLLACCADALEGQMPGVSPSRWHFIATNSDADGVARARETITKGDTLKKRELSERIAMVQREDGTSSTGMLGLTDASTSLIPTASELEGDPACSSLLRRCGRNFDEGGEELFDLIIANPPFHGTHRDLCIQGAVRDYRPSQMANRLDNGATSTSYVRERGFLTRFIEDSIRREGKRSVLDTGRKTAWYSSFINTQPDTHKVITSLQQKGVNNIVASEIKVGSGYRWAVAWNFGLTRIQGALVRELSSIKERCRCDTFFDSQKGQLHIWKSPEVVYDSENDDYEYWPPEERPSPEERIYEDLTLVSVPNSERIDVVRATAAQHLEAVLRALDGISWMRYDGESFYAPDCHLQEAPISCWLVVAREDEWVQARRNRVRRALEERRRKKEARQQAGQYERGYHRRVMEEESSAKQPSDSAPNVDGGKKRKRDAGLDDTTPMAEDSHGERAPKDASTGEGSTSGLAKEDWRFAGELTLHNYQRNESRPADLSIRLQARWLHGENEYRKDFDFLCDRISTMLKKTPEIPPKNV